MAEAWYSALANEAANGVSATEAVGAVLGGPAGAAMAGASAAARMAAAAGGGGSWSFDPEEIDAAIGEWTQLKEQLAEDRHAMAGLLNVLRQSPSDDEPTQEFMNVLAEGIAGLDESSASTHRYVVEFIEKLKDAKKSIGNEDSANADTLGVDAMGSV